MEQMQERLRAPGSPDALAQIRSEAQAARALGWVPDERRRDEFGRAFETFLSRTRDESDSGGLAVRLQRACRECHDAFKE
jgi:hypothetical protein